jgi:hypothetical protein
VGRAVLKKSIVGKKEVFQRGKELLGRQLDFLK